MITHLIKHNFRENIRSSIWQKSVLINIILGFLFIYLFTNLLVVGILSDTILEKIYPGKDIIPIFSGFILYYFLIDLFFRFNIQSLPVLSIHPYLHLPIKKRTIIHYFLLKTVFKFYNFIPIILIVPFIFRAVRNEYASSSVWAWLITIFSMILINNFLIIFIKKQMAGKIAVVFIFIALIGGLFLLDNFNILSLSAISTKFFMFLLEKPIISLILPALLTIVYLIDFVYFKSQVYVDKSSQSQGKKAFSSANFDYLHRLGNLGELMLLELKLIFRNKRTRSGLIMCIIFLAYGLIFYTQEIYLNGFAFLIFIGIFTIGLFLFNYGQFILAWESNHFDGVLTAKIDFHEYFRAKYIILLIFMTLTYILTIPYVYFGIKVLLINTAAYLFNIGINSFLMLYFATYHRKKIDLSKGAAFNYQGFSITQFIIVIPAFLIPVFIYLPFGLLGYPYAGVLTIGILGLIGLLLNKIWLNIIVKKFNRSRYKMAAGFRSNN